MLKVNRFAESIKYRKVKIFQKYRSTIKTKNGFNREKNLRKNIITVTKNRQHLVNH